MSDEDLDRFEKELEDACRKISEALENLTPVDPELVILMDFVDHRGIRSQHLVMPDGLYFSEKDGWFLEAFDLERDELVMFRLFDIHGFASETEQEDLRS